MKTVESALQSIAVPSDVLAAMDEIGEPFSAGYFGAEDEPIVIRIAEGLRRYALAVPLWEYHGEPLCPSGAPSLWHRMPQVMAFHYVRLDGPHLNILEDKRTEATSEPQREALDVLERFWTDYPGAAGWTHSIPNYRRILAEGLTSYAERVEERLTKAISEGDEERRHFYRAMQIVLETAEILRARLVATITQTELDDAQAEANRRRLLAALERVPFAPASSFYEAMVAENFIFYFDDSDNLGRFDQDLWPYYEADLQAGQVTHEEAVELVSSLWDNMDACTAWNVAIGGTNPEGQPGSTEFTLVCIEATQGKRRPNLALRLREDTPEEVWDAALDCIATGNGLPALYCEENYLRAIREADLAVAELDIYDFAFGGCTELMIHGCSNVGSLDGDINLPEVLTRTISAHLAGSASFEEFFQAYLQDLESEIEQHTQFISEQQRLKSLYHPQPTRSLLMDDCVDEGFEYAAGGARYNWSVINVMGLANAIDSLAAIREVIFEKAEITAQELLEALDANFEGHEVLRHRLQRCPRYGNADPRADELAHRLSELVFTELLKRQPWRGGRFVGSCLMFTTYARFGQRVPATPDGRFAGEPIADSAGAYQGRDVRGPTALLVSAACLDQIHAPGTLVVNIRVSQEHFQSPAGREKLKALIRGYFDLGGMQLQVLVVDQELLRDALEHPERHEDLIIRVGGYSEYWKNLTPELRCTVLERTEH